MREIKAVIGKNFGDEGKGAAVNRLCQGRNALVVRHNGGAQAGHTVEEGSFRFVFHQLGSGSLWGCPVFWSKTFLPDLYKLGEEVEDFRAEWEAYVRSASGKMEEAEGSRIEWERSGMDRAQGSERSGKWTPPHIYADRDCFCVTIYDVLLNSLAEQLRGDERHGSCGMGIYETVLRSERPEYALRLGEFVGGDVEQIAERLCRIREGYAIPRMEELLASHKTVDKQRQEQASRWIELLVDEHIPWNAAQAMCENFGRYVTLADCRELAEQYETILFENAQGLLLDWDNEEYAPHLTASHTGLKNIVELLGELLPAERTAEEVTSPLPMEILYVTRTYVTRHGAGRLDFECVGEEINPQMHDRTNLPNPWQGALRYGKHPMGQAFFRYIDQDLEWIRKAGLSDLIIPQITICLTHLDETGGVLFSDGSSMAPEEFEIFCREHGIDNYYADMQ